MSAVRWLLLCIVLVSLTKRPNPVSGSFRHLNKYITHRTTASSQLTSSEGFPIFFTAPMDRPHSQNSFQTDLPGPIAGAYSLTRRNRRALLITETELRVMA